jgi:hypothetical protein
MPQIIILALIMCVRIHRSFATAEAPLRYTGFAITVVDMRGWSRWINYLARPLPTDRSA